MPHTRPQVPLPPVRCEQLGVYRALRKDEGPILRGREVWVGQAIVPVATPAVTRHYRMKLKWLFKASAAVGIPAELRDTVREA